MPTDTQRIAFLEKQFSQLQQQVRQQSFFKVADHQQGLIPGELIAGRIRGIAPPGTAGMVLDFTGNVAGHSPIQLVSDGTYNRTQNGNLAAYTDPNGVSSPAGPGMRVLDANGNILFDSIGVAQVMKLLGSILNVSQSMVTGNGNWQTVSGTTVTFSLARQITVLGLAAVNLLDPTVSDTGFNLEGAVLVDGAYNASQAPILNGDLGGALTPFAIATLAAGSHNLALGVNQTNAKLWTASGCYLYVFSLGS